MGVKRYIKLGREANDESPPTGEFAGKVYHNEAPHRSNVLLRMRNGAFFETDEVNRAYDPMHFVLLFPCGDDGWMPSLHRQPRAQRQRHGGEQKCNAATVFGLTVFPAKAALPSPNPLIQTVRHSKVRQEQVNSESSLPECAGFERSALLPS